jgi:hypothetical protein
MRTVGKPLDAVPIIEHPAPRKHVNIRNGAITPQMGKASNVKNRATVSTLLRQGIEISRSVIVSSKLIRVRYLIPPASDPYAVHPYHMQKYKKTSADTEERISTRE